MDDAVPGCEGGGSCAIIPCRGLALVAADISVLWCWDRTHHGITGEDDVLGMAGMGVGGSYTLSEHVRSW